MKSHTLRLALAGCVLGTTAAGCESARSPSSKLSRSPELKTRGAGAASHGAHGAETYTSSEEKDALQGPVAARPERVSQASSSGAAMAVAPAAPAEPTKAEPPRGRTQGLASRNDGRRLSTKKASGLGTLSKVGVGGLGTHGAGAPAPVGSVADRDDLELSLAPESRAVSEPADALRTAEHPFSTFAIDVDTAAYSLARRSLAEGHLPDLASVRVEEFVNYFNYDYQAPKSTRSNLFSIEVDGARLPTDANKRILRVGIQARRLSAETRLPVNLVFLVDTSGSMSSSDKLELAKRSIMIAVEQLGARDRVAVVTYAGGVSRPLAPTSAKNFEQIRRAVASLESGGGTAMESGMDLAYRTAAEMLNDGSLTRVIVMSDGDANIGYASPREILKRIDGYVKEGVTMSTIGYGTGNYRDDMMETLADHGNGNYAYIDTERQAERVFGLYLMRMLQDVAQDVKIQVEFNEKAVRTHRLIGYENRKMADRDFRDDRKDAGEIGAGHSVTALYELVLESEVSSDDNLATVRVRAKEPRGVRAKETALAVAVSTVAPAFEEASPDLRFATAVMAGAELLRFSPHAEGWSFGQVAEIARRVARNDPDRREFVAMMQKAQALTGEPIASARRPSLRRLGIR
ncbi:MAG: von Willebrand factor type A domain-containing protein [Deltaproteobacteria bacterium]|nr:von Willebrand factor type A domain-containing protein [Deltaproteobacteria bacterium]